MPYVRNTHPISLISKGGRRRRLLPESEAEHLAADPGILDHRRSQHGFCHHAPFCARWAVYPHPPDVPACQYQRMTHRPSYHQELDYKRGIFVIGYPSVCVGGRMTRVHTREDATLVHSSRATQGFETLILKKC